MKKRTKKGFTLIELIVVITILAILAVIAIPVVTGWVDKARDAEAAANARTIELAAKAYMTENDVVMTSANLTLALAEFGISDPISDSSADYSVASNGAVTIDDDGNGDITFN